MPANRRTVVAFLLFPGVTQLDLTGPAQVLSRLGDTDIHLVAKTLAPVETDCGFALLPTTTIEQLRSAEILCVPGGRGDLGAMNDDEILDWLQAIGGDAAWVTSVCTGALILGAAGLLRGYRATTHWAHHQYLQSFGAIPVRGRVVVDRNRMTGAGVTAGIDFALSLAALITGEDQAKLIQLSLEYDPAPPFKSGSATMAEPALLERYWALAALTTPGRHLGYAAAAHRFQGR